MTELLTFLLKKFFNTFVLHTNIKVDVSTLLESKYQKGLIFLASILWHTKSRFYAVGTLPWKTVLLKAVTKGQHRTSAHHTTISTKHHSQGQEFSSVPDRMINGIILKMTVDWGLRRSSKAMDTFCTLQQD